MRGSGGKRAWLAGTLTALMTLALSVVSIAHAADPPDSPATVSAPDDTVMTYVVVSAADGSGIADSVQAVQSAGGTVVDTYPKIGVVIAYSADPAFADTVRGAPSVQAVGATRTTKVPLSHFDPVTDPQYTGPGAPGSDQVPAEGTAWDAVALDLDAAHQITQGSRNVLVGVLDTGVEDTHPKLAGAFDEADSVSCLSGKADTSHGAWRPTLDNHGTHVAGTIAAARTGSGVVGVAPGVRIAALKLAERDDQETAETMICGFTWAADHGVRIANNSYKSTPWRFNCPNQIDQAAIITSVGRAVAYAQSKGMLIFASAGNSGIDLSNRSSDNESPADGTPVHRDIDNSCIRLPHELPGVLGVAALDQAFNKAGFSNYSLTSVAVTAPGVSIWSTVPAGKYTTKSGTSMSTPHATGVAALIASQHPDWTSAQIRDQLLHTAKPMTCPDNTPCTSDGQGNTSYFGAGMVDAAGAVQSVNTTGADDPGGAIPADDPQQPQADPEAADQNPMVAITADADPAPHKNGSSPDQANSPEATVSTPTRLLSMLARTGEQPADSTTIIALLVSAVGVGLVSFGRWRRRLRGNTRPTR